MNRELKFRQAGFNKDGSFREWHYWGFVGDGQFVGVELNSSVHQQAKEHTCQYTGLKDINGKEIYEGDIIIFLDKDKHQRKATTHYGAVIFQDGVFKLSPTPIRWNALYLSLLYSRLEVVGNIYENPELKEQ